MKDILHRYATSFRNYVVENPLYIITYGSLILGLCVFIHLTLRSGLALGAIFSLLPAILAFFVYLLRYPKYYAACVLILSYFIAGLSRYVAIKPGVVFDAALFSLLGILLFYTVFMRMNWRRTRSGLLFLSGIWLAYCFLLLFNPQSASSEAWLTTVRWTAIYMFVIVMIVPLVITNIKDVKCFLYILSVLTLLAVFKAAWQKYYGFDTAEKYWLYVLGGSTTHIIYTGIRYFSFFTDAANFGTSMGFSTIVLGISAFYMPSKRVKVYFAIVSVLALWGLFLSGTRSSIVVLFVGAAGFVVLSKNIRYIVLGSLGTAFMVCFLMFTTIGNGNQYIRRMRTVFDSNDASYVVRKENKKLIKEYMVDKPFGVGIGLAGGKAKRFTPDAYIAQIATDSWLVQLWIETGIVGVTLYVLMYLCILIYGAYQILFKIRDKILRGINTALVSALAGVLVNAYANEIVGQFPNGILIFTSMAILYISKYIDADIASQKALKQ